jgi:mannose-6-phosphate isomerase-like protein (cupin superfamily)
MAEMLKLTASESLEVQSESPELLEVIASYGPEGHPPPPHFHPAQDEHFEVLEGRLTTRVDGVERELGPDEQIAIPRSVPHQMWNASPEPARVRWQTRPGGRTIEWFRGIDRLHREDNLEAGAELLAQFKDTIRIA